MSEGRLAGELPAGSDEETILALAAGVGRLGPEELADGGLAS